MSRSTVPISQLVDFSVPAKQRWSSGVYTVNCFGNSVALLYDNTIDDGGWMAVKYMYNTNTITETTAHHASENYYLSLQILRRLARHTTDVLFREDVSNTLARFASTSACQTVLDNIIHGRSWFYNTHGNNTLAGWLVGIDGKNIPDAQQSGCNSYSTTGPLMIFDSCANAFGSHAYLNQTYRLRGDGYTTGKVHSIWFKVG